MIAPVIEENARGRMVYLPEPMRMVRYRALDDYDTEDLAAGDHYVSADLNEMVFFIRPGHAVPVAKPAPSTQAMDFDHLRVLANPGDAERITYTLYDDDGYTTDIDAPEHFHTIEVTADGARCATKQVELIG